MSSEEEDREILDDVFFQEYCHRLDVFRETRVAPEARSDDLVPMWFYDEELTRWERRFFK